MGKKILLADDSITIQKVIELTFSDEDFDVITVGNGRLALEKLPEVRPDIVLCDIIMPEKDGYEVCEQIKTNPATSHVPVLLLTGAFEPFDQERAARAGYDGSLAKPFEPETLIAKVKDLLARAPVRPPAAPAHAARPSPSLPPVVTAPPPPAVAAPPPVLPFPRPVPPPARPAPAPPPARSAPARPGFIPDEPFGGLDESAFGEGAPEAAPAGDAFAPMTEEESATLLAPPAPEPPPIDTASTVMFRAGEVPWSPPPPVAPVPPPVGRAEPSVVTTRAPEPEPAFVPERVEAPVAEEPPVFEEVLEEDLDFGETSYVPEPARGPRVPTDTIGAPTFAPVATVPPLREAEAGGTTGAFEPLRPSEPTPVEPTPFEPEPEPGLEPEAPPMLEPEPAPVREPEPARLALPPRLSAAAKPAAARVAAESFADVVPPLAASPAPPASEAAAVSVPVEMVEKIAQRVVAQISEKVVREIAWEVIPDLAEALIKQEIERLKAELQKT
jgi:CheY-like chemotaxis protein